MTIDNLTTLSELYGQDSYEEFLSNLSEQEREYLLAQVFAEVEDDDEDEDDDDDEEDDEDEDEENLAGCGSMGRKKDEDLSDGKKKKPKAGGTSSYGTFSEVNQFSEPATETDDPKKLMIIELADDFSCGTYLSDGSDKRYFKVPIAVLGEWVHPQYGKVKFTQTDFDQMKANFSIKVTGYEPPLFLGHPVDRDSVEAAPAVAFLSDLTQEEDVLFGYFEVVDPNVYEDVKLGKYRYSSAELVREAVSKKTGEDIGTCLIGCALTNRPFLTEMPRVAALAEKFSECAELHTSFLFPLKTKFSETHNMSEIATNESQSVTTESSVEALSERLMALTKLCEDAEAKASRYEALLAERLLAEKIEKIRKLNLSESIKQEYSELLSVPNLAPEVEEKFMSMLHKLSEENDRLLLEQRGTSTETEQANSPEQFSVNPYEDILEANNQLAQKLAEKRQAQLRLV